MLFVLYNLLFLPLAALYLIWFAFSNRRGLLKKLPQELRERFASYPVELERHIGDRPVYWFHAASLGELKALQPLIAKVRAARPGHAIVLTTSNSVARQQASILEGPDAVMLAPLDFYPLAKSAMAALAPKTLIVAETELWPSLVRAARERGTRVAVVNGRISGRSARRYAWIRPLIGQTLASVDVLCAQSPEDASRFAGLGAAKDRVHAVGNLKYDQFFSEQLDVSAQKARLEEGPKWHPSDPVFIAGSTHKGEEEAVLDAFAAARSASPKLRLILAPRHLERLWEVAAELKRRGLRWTRWTEPHHAADVVLVDVVGILGYLYGVGNVAFVGGTLIPKGGHNLLEPVRFSIPVLFGPHTSNLQNVADLLRTSGGGIEVSDTDALSKVLTRLVCDLPGTRNLGLAARSAAESLRGATDRTLPFLLPLL